MEIANSSSIRRSIGNISHYLPILLTVNSSIVEQLPRDDDDDLSTIKETCTHIH